MNILADFTFISFSGDNFASENKNVELNKILLP